MVQWKNAFNMFHQLYRSVLAKVRSEYQYTQQNSWLCNILPSWIRCYCVYFSYYSFPCSAKISRSSKQRYANNYAFYFSNHHPYLSFVRFFGFDYGELDPAFLDVNLWNFRGNFYCKRTLFGTSSLQIISIFKRFRYLDYGIPCFSAFTKPI